MATHCPVGFDVAQLEAEIRSIYSRVAEEPDGDFHFHRGPEFAAERLGYEKAALDALPRQSTASFAGVGNPHSIRKIEPGEVVLDIGCGAGMDLLLAAVAVGPSGRAVGVDMVGKMRARAQASAEKCELRNVEVRAGSALSLPIEDASIDVVISNGVINLVPDKARAFQEVVRVLKPGGRLQLADIIVNQELSEDVRNDIDLWTG